MRGGRKDRSEMGDKVGACVRKRKRKREREKERVEFMAGLQRSAVSFRRQGSSGLVWDDKLVSAELNNDNNEQDQKGVGGDLNVRPITVQRSRSNGGYRTGKVSPAIEPPSPKVSACGFCSAFGKTGDKKGPRTKPKLPNKHRSR